MDEEKRINIQPKPEKQLTSAGKPIIDPNTNKPVKRKKGRPRKNPPQKEKRPVGRPRTKPLGPAKAKGEKRVMTKARKQHLEKMRVALRAARARRRAEKEAALKGKRPDNLRGDMKDLGTTKVEPDHVGNPGRQTTEFVDPAPKPDYNQPALHTSESVLTRGLEQDHFHSNYDVDHHTFVLGGHPSGVSHPGSSAGASKPPIVGHPRPSVTRGSGTGDIAHSGDTDSFFL